MPRYDPELAQDLLKQANYKGDPIPYRLLNNYYTNQIATAQVLVEMWKPVGLNVQIETKENWSQIMERGRRRAVRDWSNSAAFNDPVSSLVAQHGPNGQQQQIGEWTNAELNKLCELLETSTDRARPQEGVPPHAGDRRARGPGLYGAAPERDLHGEAEVDASGSASPAFAMDFRARQLRWLDRCRRWSGIDPASRSAFDGVPVLHGVDLAVHKGEALGLRRRVRLGQVGDLARRARPACPARQPSRGCVRLDGTEMLGAPAATLDEVRGGRVAMIFQDPASALNPVLNVGRQLGEALALHRGLSGRGDPCRSAAAARSGRHPRCAAPPVEPIRTNFPAARTSA